MNVLLLSWFTSVTFSFSPGFNPVTRYSTGNETVSTIYSVSPNVFDLCRTENRAT